MQTIMDAAAQIGSEIERTRLHLAKLEQALDGLRPLLVIKSSQSILAYAPTETLQTIEDVRVIKPRKVKTTTRKSTPSAKDSKVQKRPKQGKVAPTSGKSKTTSPSDSLKLPNTGNEIWLKAIGRKKLTQNELTDSTLSLLKLGADARAAIRNRAGAWLNASVKKNQITASTNRAGLKVYTVARA